jgi:hypothetical protein
MSEKSVDAVKAGHGPRLLVETDRVSYGVTRVFKDVKEPDETLPDQPRDFVEREYEVGDEALVVAVDSTAPRVQPRNSARDSTKTGRSSPVSRPRPRRPRRSPGRA